ncbi:MAG: NADH-quinone oxidoreductase subunit B family protein [Methanoregula sp.]|nr:NADH-quinone oxidoreductase subunit B family protein [Methanoregula sp.]
MGLIDWAKKKSPWICHFNTGGCNACDIETIAALTPRFDIERFGILLKGSPRHADVLVVTGPVTLQSEERLVRIYDQMVEPKFVVAIGVCACSGGVYWKCYNVKGGVDRVIPVDVYVGGCPPRPSEIIDGMVQVIGKMGREGHVINSPEGLAGGQG